MTVALQRALLDGLEAQGRSLAEMTRARTDQVVPACPGWTIHNVLGHLGRVYRSVTMIVGERRQSMPSRDEVPRPPEDDSVHAFFTEGLAQLSAALRGIQADEPVYTWAGGDKSRGAFYLRRMPHETAVHTADVAHALGVAWSYPPLLAADAIDEIYDVVLGFAVDRWPSSRPVEPLRLHAPDADSSWVVRFVDGRIVADRETGPPAPAHDSAVPHDSVGGVTLTGPAERLLLFAWNRGHDALHIDGDPALAAAWAGLAP